jgi:hypothetical protein
MRHSRGIPSDAAITLAQVLRAARASLRRFWEWLLFAYTTEVTDDTR